MTDYNPIAILSGAICDRSRSDRLAESATLSKAIIAKLLSLPTVIDDIKGLDDSVIQINLAHLG